MRRLFAFGLLLVFAASCTKVYNQRERSASITTPTPVTEDVIEFRVLGNVTVPVTIRHSNSLDGLTVNAGASLPYYAAIRSTDDSIFLLLEANITAGATPPTVPPVVQVQIFVNGRVFRESYATGATLQAQASGTYRRP